MEYHEQLIVNSAVEFNSASLPFVDAQDKLAQTDSSKVFEFFLFVRRVYK